MARTVAQTLLAGLGVLLFFPAQAEIVQRQVVTAISSVAENDVLTLVADSGCGGRQVRMDAASLGLAPASYAAMKVELAGLLGAPILLTLDACPAEKNVILQVSKLERCEPQTCSDGKARLYLNHNLSQAESKAQARYAVVVPLPPGKQAGTWQVEIFHVKENEPRRLSGQVDAPDYLQGKLVGSYAVYYPYGGLEMQVEQDAPGSGRFSRYRQDGKLLMRGSWRNGRQGGSGPVTMGGDGEVESFDENGKLIARTRMRGGRVVP